MKDDEKVMLIAFACLLVAYGIVMYYLGAKYGF
jgi:hypothetical protein